ncbi:MAG: hypothetical protein Q8P59_13615, partial [Dehalococcoidia bacterium]|nr:hypothetical protein [Dehalococcoidia bacterium]
LAAIGTFWVETGSARELYKYNPHATAGYPTAPDNKNLVLHSMEEESFPYAGKYLALHLVRLLSGLMGLVTVVATYLLVREASGGDGPVAAGAAALVAFNPMFLFVSGSANNDNLVNALASLTLMTLTGVLMGKLTVLRLGLLGLLVGAASLSKLNGLALLPLSLFVLAVFFQRKRRWSSFARAATLVVSLSAVVAGWWYARNWLIYGDPLGLNVFLSTVGSRRSTITQLLGEMEGLKLSFWGVFGGFNILMGQPAYWFYDGLSVAAVFGLLALVLVTVKSGFRFRPWLLAMHFLWMGAVALALARWTSMTLASQGRLLFAALPSITLFLALGLFSHGPARLRGLAVAALSLLLAGMAAVVPFLYIMPAYPSPPIVSSETAREFSNPLYINFDDKIELLGYELSPREARPGADVTVTLYWRILNPM